ncbi:MAG: family metallohydrolase [Frankiales bacterium]|nr:family metallohydrolase [Frankiales bacterium]
MVWPSVVRVTAPATGPGGRSPAAPEARPAVRSRDQQRARVYRAEDAWAARLDAARQGAVLATVGGSSLLLPGERRLGSLTAAGQYAARVLSLPGVVAVVGAAAPLAVRPRRGVRAAHWEPPGTIALPVPVHGEPWALRETVLLHELAHHVGETTGRSRGHRAPFPAVLLLLVAEVLGEEAAFALRVDYGDEGVEVGVL